MKSLLQAFFVLCLPLAAAELKFETKLKELTPAPDAAKIIADFPFKNESGEVVEIAEYTASCSCIQASISPKDKLVYLPGERGVIRAEFELNALDGIVDKAVGIRLKGDPKDEPSVSLVTRLNIPQLVVVEPKTMFWNTGEEAKPKTATVTINHTEPINITSISCVDQRFTQELKTIEAGKKYEIVVTPKDSNTLAMAVIHFDTDSKFKRFRSYRLFAVVRNAPKTAETAAKP